MKHHAPLRRARNYADQQASKESCFMSEQRPNGNANGPDRGDRGGGNGGGGGGDRPPRRNGGGRNTPPGMKFGRGIFGWALFIGLVIMLFVVLKREQGNAYDLPVGQ